VTLFPYTTLFRSTSVTRPDGEAVLRKSFVVEDGQAGAVEA
jgi:hypothetical protein